MRRMEMTLEFFFERDENKRADNFQMLICHINEYVKEHPELEFNKIEYCDPSGWEVYALVSFKENEAKIKTLESLVQNLTAKVERQRIKINDLERSLDFAKECFAEESLFGKNIVNDVNKDVVESIKNACPEGHPAKKIVEEMLQPNAVPDKLINKIPDEVVDKMVDDMDKGLSAREVIDNAISSLDDGVYV